MARTAAKPRLENNERLRFSVYCESVLLKRFRKACIDRETRVQKALEESLRLWLRQPQDGYQDRAEG
jgi:hypothetical protein